MGGFGGWLDCGLGLRHKVSRGVLVGGLGRGEGRRWGLGGLREEVWLGFFGGLCGLHRVYE